VEWTIDVENASGYTLPVIWVEDTLGGAYAFASSVGDPPFTSDNGTVDGQTVVWELRNVNHGDVVSLTLRATSDSAPSCSDDLDNTASAWWGCGIVDGSSGTKPGVDPPDHMSCLATLASDTATRTETREPAIGLLDVSLLPVSIDACNDSVQFTLEIGNSGPTDASSVDLVITLPTGLIYNPDTSESGLGTDTASATAAIGPIGNPTIAGSQLIYYDIADTPAGKANNIADVIEAGNDPGNNDTLVLRFSVQSSCYAGADVDLDMWYYDCCDDTQHSTSDSYPVAALEPDLAITKTPVDDQVDCGAATPQTWTITVTNNGDGNAQVVRIEDTLGDWLDYVSSSSTYPGAGAATPMPAAPTQTYGWEINNLAAGATAEFTIIAELNPDAPQADCSEALRQNDVRAIWGCGTAGDATDGNPNSQAYDCTYTDWVDAPTAILRMPDLRVTNVTPTISCVNGAPSGSLELLSKISVTARHYQQVFNLQSRSLQRRHGLIHIRITAALLPPFRQRHQPRRP
jgi:uncharacterized repeat protein (TIGR01451 family)